MVLGNRGRIVWLAAGVVWALAGRACGDDWPTYQADNARSGRTAERLRTPLVRQWVFNSPHPPARGCYDVATGEVLSYGVRRFP